MSDPVELSVRSSLQKIIDELDGLKAKAKETGDSFKQAGDGVGEELNKNVKRTETFFTQLRSLSRRVADQLRGDFKSLISLNALTDAMKLSNQLRQSIDQTVELSDTVRKLGTTFGIAGKDFASFQTKMAEGLGDLGLDTDVAAKALKGLSTTPVRGEGNLLQYSQAAGMLASIGGEKGREGEIAKGLANVIQARGGNVNDTTQMAKLAESLRRVFVQTGASPTDTLRDMQAIFASMPQDIRKSITDAGLANLAAASQVAGPNATRFLEEYLGKSPIARLAFEAQGGKGVFNDKGVDIEKFQKFFKDITARVGGDPRLAAQTLGLSEEAAEGFVRLGENLDKVREAQRRIAATTGTLNEEYRESMGLGEAFRANINKVKQSLAAPMSAATQGASDTLSKAAQSPLGAAAVVGGATLTAAALTGLAMKGIGGGLGKGIAGKAAGAAGAAARTEAAESIFGTKVVPVYVTNVDEIGAGAGTESDLGSLGKMAAGGGIASLALPVAATIGGAVLLHKQFQAGEEEINKGAADKGTDSSKFTEGQIATFRKAYEGGKVPEKQRERTKQILDDYDKRQATAKIMGTAERGQVLGAPGAGGPPSTTGAGQSTGGGAATMPTQIHKVVVESKDPRLKVNVETPPRGASF